MEDGPDIYFSGNTVIPPSPGRKRRAKTLDPPGGYAFFQGRIPQNQEHKICATKKCIWCGLHLDQFFISCPNCHNCQWCGMIDYVDPYRCFLCGNFLPDELRTIDEAINKT